MMNDKRKELIVKKIENGTVIDHIPKGKGIVVMRILRVDCNTECYLLQNVESKKLGRKDIVKIVGRYPSKEEVDDIAIVAPTATINYVKNWGIFDKYRVKLPEKIEGLIKCPNNLCITNHERGMKTVFKVYQFKNELLKNLYGDVLLQCSYCDTLVKHENIEELLI